MRSLLPSFDISDPDTKKKKDYTNPSSLVSQNTKKKKNFFESSLFHREDNQNGYFIQRHDPTYDDNFYDKEEEQNVSIKIMKNRNTDIKLLFRKDLNLFVIKKHNLYSRKSFKNEFNILQILKDKNITLNVISKEEEENKSFQQIAGFTDLSTFKKMKMKCNNHHFEMYFFILLDKLNKMHNEGIAHSDIKPNNIVLSFSYEPFFIDFGASVFLSSYDNYLNTFTQAFNLDIYLKPSNSEQNQRNYIFKSEEEVKLCDKTQLALTFLYLVCNYENEMKLFKEKKFNDLFISLFDRSNLNSRIFLYFLSRILNQADFNIQIIGQSQEQIIQTYFIDYDIIYEHLFLSIDSNQQKTITQYYQQSKFAQKIDKFNIQLIYCLLKQNFNLNLKLNQTLLFPCPEMEEYQFICEKLQINEYCEKLLESNCSDNINFFNMCQYIKVIQKKQCSLYLSNLHDVRLEMLVDSIISSQFIDCFDLIIYDHKFNYKFFEKFNKKSSQFFIQNILFYQEISKCKIIRQINENLKQNVHVSIKLSQCRFNYSWDSQINYILKMFQNNTYYKNVNIILQCEYITNRIQKISDLIKKIQQMKQTQTFFINIKIQRKMFHLFKTINKKKKIDIKQYQIEDSNFLTKFGFQAFYLIFEDLMIEQNLNRFTIKFFEINLDKIKIWTNMYNLIKNKCNNQQFQFIFEKCELRNDTQRKMKEMEKKIPQLNFQCNKKSLNQGSCSKSKIGFEIEVLNNEQKQQNISGFKVQFINQFEIDIYSQEEIENINSSVIEESHQKVMNKLCNQSYSKVNEMESYHGKQLTSLESQKVEHQKQIYISKENNLDQINQFKTNSDYEKNQVFNQFLTKDDQYNYESSCYQVNKSEEENNNINVNELRKINENENESENEEKDWQQQEILSNNGVQDNQQKQQFSIEVLQQLLMGRINLTESFFKDIKVNNKMTEGFLNVQVINKSALYVSELDQIKFIIYDLKNKIHYKQIEINIGWNQFSYQLNHPAKDQYNESDLKIKLQICDLDFLINEFMKLYSAIFYNLLTFQLSIRHQTSFEIEMRKLYPFFIISQEIYINYHIKQIYHYDLISRFGYLLNILIEERQKPSRSFQYLDLFDNMKDFKQKYFIEPQKIFRQLKIYNYLLNVIFYNIDIGNKSFIIILQKFEKIFKKKNKFYEINNCGLTHQVLYDIHEFSNKNQKCKRIQFDLTESISYSEFKEYIKFIMQTEQKNKFAFCFEFNYGDKLQEQIKNDFKEMINEEISENQVILNKNKKNKIFIKLNFNQTQYFNYKRRREQQEQKNFF